MTYLFRIHSLASAFWFISLVSLVKFELETSRLLGKYNPSPSTPQPPAGSQRQFCPQYICVHIVSSNLNNVSSQISSVLTMCLGQKLPG